MNIENKIKNELIRTTELTHRNGWNNRTTYGYHSYIMPDKNVNILGQRVPSIRLDNIKKHVSFQGKVVADFGCNVGGMLHHLPEIKEGYGFDFDINCITAGNNISEILGMNDKVKLYQHDFDRNTYEELSTKLPNRIDISLLLSLHAWITSWKELATFAINHSNAVIFESNIHNQEILDFIRTLCSYTMIDDKSLDDTTGNYTRQTYILTK